jgi:phosphatidylserine decarboxylase
MDDCHRYIFSDDGGLQWTKTIKGKLHTVQPISHSKYKPYVSNHRIVSELKTKHFGNIIVVEVGALLVGRINNHHKTQFKKGEEKGYFELGGSTIIILLKPNTLRVDKDIVRYSKENIVTKVKQGETIGGLYV